jgi:hypothetical protein
MGVIVDAVAAILMISPSVWSSFNGLTIGTTGSGTVLALGPGVSLMAGWTILLIWADRKPVERKGVLLITIFPVIAGLAIYNVYGIVSGLEAAVSVLPVLALQAGLVALFGIGYYNARDIHVGPTGQPL